jgi:acetyl-CoA carboxylase biotin carboxyl carrier protein
LDLKVLNDILDILDKRDVAELEIEEGGTRVRIRRAEAAPPAVVLPQAASGVVHAAQVATPASPSLAPGAASAATSGAAEAAQEAGLHVLSSPIVGTFYRAPDPNSPVYVNEGDRVRVGQVLCIIEAMKLMNEIEAEVAGTIVKIHQENGQPVQYGASLFSIRPDR